ncbi:MAG: DUF3391 domain-containing protein [Leptospiraceae bacterium]|nr:DUF3391 domain-containing protein [Leptospiraceae bacterium]
MSAPKKIKTAELRPGMVFDQPVFIDSENVLVQANQEISGRDIERLVKWGITEVETSGSLMAKKARDEDDPSDAPPPAATGFMDPGLISRPDDALKKIIQRYDQLRRNKRNFKRLLSESADVLHTNIRNLYENRQFENRAVIDIANRLTNEICEKPLMLIMFQATRFTPEWIVHHALHAGAYACLLGQEMRYSRPRLQELMFATILMDTGMLSVPGHILEKTEQLNEKEWANVKAHPLLGYKLLTSQGKVKSSLANVSLQHQETFHGKGYPQGLKGGQIEEISRIAHIVDSYTAMIERRPYRKANLPYEAMKTILSVDMHSYDPKLLRLFLGLVSIYPIGSIIKLSNDMTGMVVASKADKPLRPVIRLMRDAEGLPFNDLYFLDLTQKTELYIVSAISPASAGIQLEAEI